LGRENYVVVDVDIVNRLKDSINKYSLCCWEGAGVIHELLFYVVARFKSSLAVNADDFSTRRHLSDF
jgi:hypothetical protein